MSLFVFFPLIPISLSVGHKISTKATTGAEGNIQLALPLMDTQKNASVCILRTHTLHKQRRAPHRQSKGWQTQLLGN